MQEEQFLQEMAARENLIALLKEGVENNSEEFVKLSVMQSMVADTYLHVQQGTDEFARLTPEEAKNLSRWVT